MCVSSFAAVHSIQYCILLFSVLTHVHGNVHRIKFPTRNQTLQLHFQGRDFKHWAQYMLQVAQRDLVQVTRLMAISETEREARIRGEHDEMRRSTTQRKTTNQSLSSSGYTVQPLKRVTKKRRKGRTCRSSYIKQGPWSKQHAKHAYWYSADRTGNSLQELLAAAWRNLLTPSKLSNCGQF